MRAHHVLLLLLLALSVIARTQVVSETRKRLLSLLEPVQAEHSHVPVGGGHRFKGKRVHRAPKKLTKPKEHKAQHKRTLAKKESEESMAGYSFRSRDDSRFQGTPSLPALSVGGMTSSQGQPQQHDVRPQVLPHRFGERSELPSGFQGDAAVAQ